MATSRRNAKSPTIRRILREAQELAASPSADLAAAPLETDLFEWHFTLRGPPNSVYSEGIYHGRIVLPPTYPLRPPSFRFSTPSGRFEANREICLSISGHHEETWQPAWGLRTALVALRSFMETDPKGQVGGVEASDMVRRRLAIESASFVCTGCGGRTNAAILEASAAEEAAAGGSAATKEADVVPAELKLVFRDELPTPQTAPAGAASEGSGGSGGPTAPAAAPATTTTTATPTPATPLEGQLPSPPPPPPAAPAHAVPAPTPTIPLPDAQPAAAAVAAPPAPAPGLTIAAGRVARRMQPQTAAPAPGQRDMQRRVRPHSDEAVPVWVDRTIVVLSVVLGAMLLRLVFG
ncbi:ubiquitin-conjugating enzyme E2 J1 [Sporothrix schenckii 1099-18]|uniref:UBC core domain-containing protein n=2 Tax=Sporothrix schenckii TaxID=29908 RepID=U7PLW1_SPOS1|nr:ubiquitin-conjugating enzyme E2 J1 [Sporothrix schenckii 1099-18]ERS95739.1 hypothetical protein HMPREF1624_07814 [Sporothrix schenckii ATCC 58251]KJR83758.1 ubiquitin-conjugating enzyme E2 J1 [Sporothrix schenckii 1099-18]